MAARNLLLPVAMFAVYAGLVRLIELRAASELDVRRGLATFLTGAASGALLMGALYLILWGLGMAKFWGGTGLDGLTVAIVYNLATAMGEELLFRAVLFRVVEEATVFAVAIGISAASFATEASILALESALSLRLSCRSHSAKARIEGVAFSLPFAVRR